MPTREGPALGRATGEQIRDSARGPALMAQINMRRRRRLREAHVQIAEAIAKARPA